MKSYLRDQQHHQHRNIVFSYGATEAVVLRHGITANCVGALACAIPAHSSHRLMFVHRFFMGGV